MIRGLFALALVWLSVGAPHLGLPQDRPSADGDAVRQASDNLRDAAINSLADVRRQLMADRKSAAWEMQIPLLVAGKTGG